MHMEKKTTVPDFRKSDKILCAVLSVVFVGMLIYGFINYF
jgi:hypothetical protein